MKKIFAILSVAATALMMVVSCAKEQEAPHQPGQRTAVGQRCTAVLVKSPGGQRYPVGPYGALVGNRNPVRSGPLVQQSADAVNISPVHQRQITAVQQIQGGRIPVAYQTGILLHGNTECAFLIFPHHVRGSAVLQPEASLHQGASGMHSRSRQHHKRTAAHTGKPS